MQPSLQAPADNDTSKPDWIDDISRSPAQRELLLHYSNRDELRRLRIKYDNVQSDLRELELLRHEKHASITNSVTSAIIATAGGTVISGPQLVVDIMGAMTLPVGFTLLACGIIFGVIKPPVEAYFWKKSSSKKDSYICPYCKRDIKR